MQLTITYNKDKDIWCLMNYGKSSQNSPHPTPQYEQLIKTYGEHPTPEQVSSFIDHYTIERNINISLYVENFKKEWSFLEIEFHKKAEMIFGVSLPHMITVYPTMNGRCPYSIQDNFFYISLESSSGTTTAMHELWHFYTWYVLGVDEKERLGNKKYNELKEALTVLLNVEYKDLLAEGTIDVGYPQHQKLREKILIYWEKDKNIHRLWDYLTSEQ